jgi:hypothetical protein
MREVAMRGRLILAGLLIVLGVGWVAQGLGALPGSGFMDGDARWAIGGAVAVLVGLGLALSVARSRSSGRP